MIKPEAAKLRLRRKAGAVRDWLAAQAPRHRQARARNEAARVQGLALLDRFSRAGEARWSGGPILVDGAWDNTNYWLRYAILRRALGLHTAQEIGMPGAFSRRRVGAAFDALGIRERADAAVTSAQLRRFRPEARRLLAATRTPDDILRWQLPDELPPVIVYDGLLKRQRRGTVWLAHPLIEDHVAEALAASDNARRIVEAHRPGLMVLSHPTDFHFGTLAWTALRHGVRVLLLQGDFGVLRAIDMRKPADIFAYPLRPGVAEMDGASPAQRISLERTGAAYLESRLSGRTADISAIYAFKRRQDRVTRADIAAGHGWDPAKPIVVAFAPNWFDYPHFCGPTEYRDYADWVAVTLDVARETTDVNWLFKSHPCDEWYGRIDGARLVDMLGTPPAHMAMVDPKWTGRDLLEAVDGLLTFHGLGGIEAASLGKGVLLPYHGWYGHVGFARAADSAAAYRALLRTRWWEKIDRDAAARRAKLFAGWCFGVPAWHGDYAFQDDSNQDAIWWDLEAFLAEQGAALEREMALMREWRAGNEPYYHIFKMRRAEAHVPPASRVVGDATEDPRKRQLQTAAPPAAAAGR
jgi:hypothetical protein